MSKMMLQLAEGPGGVVNSGITGEERKRNRKSVKSFQTPPVDNLNVEPQHRNNTSNLGPKIYHALASEVQGWCGAYRVQGFRMGSNGLCIRTNGTRPGIIDGPGDYWRAALNELCALQCNSNGQLEGSPGIAHQDGDTCSIGDVSFWWIFNSSTQLGLTAFILALVRAYNWLCFLPVFQELLKIGPSDSNLERDSAISCDEVAETEQGSEGVKCYKNVLEREREQEQGGVPRRGSIKFSQREEFWDDEETAKKGNDPYNYEGTMLNARVRKDESRVHDANMVDESRDNVDVLLVFSMSESLTTELVLVQRAFANGSLVDAFSPSLQSPRIAFVPATSDVWFTCPS
ncbi:hypothetical protein ARMSODRAFT_974505 [Armillaria solidipes]|uniref:Uncharacterized protein n=1 Tax=Armillaria solidipes TaxID=1076256 RepID=A0A2H3BGM1_9AGAR|nr:hypothetical protein ARMSODRAFT_974505 [Armillaria solidipes]